MNKDRIKKNTFYSIVKSCSSIIFPLITFPYISRVLLAENVGKINFSLSIVSYFSLIASLGISTYAVRECAKVRNNNKEFNDTSNEIFSINLCTTLIAYLLLFIVLLCSKKLEDYKLLIMIHSISILFTTLGTDWLNTALEDFKYITIRTLLFQILSLLFMFLFVKNPDDYVKYAIITVIASSGANILNIIYVRKHCKLKFVRRMNFRKHFKPIFLLFGMILAQQIFVNSDITILGLINGDYDVGLYSTSVKIYNIVCTLLNSIAWVVIPKLSYYFEKKDYNQINSIMKYVIGFSFTFGFPMALGLLFLSPNIIYVIAGSDYLGATISLRILSFAFIFSFIWGIFMNMLLLPDRKEKICLKACTISAVANIILNLIFIPIFGFAAAAITTVLAQFIGLIMCYKSINNNIQFDISKKFILGIIIGCLAISIYILIILSLINSYISSLLISIFGSVLIYFIIQLILKNYWVCDLIQGFITKILSRK